MSHECDRAPPRRQTAGAVAAVLGILLLTVAGSARAQNPLEPVDTSSPRATFASFHELADEVARRYEALLEAPGPATQSAFRQIRPRISRLFDVSEVAPAARMRVANETYFLLWDVFSKVELPEINAVPDEIAIASEAEAVDRPPRWQIPGTEITIARVADGARAGEYLFTSDTVARAREWYEATRDLPVLFAMPLEDVYRINQRVTGWMLPPAWFAALPEWANSTVADQALWKWIALLVLVGAVLWAAVAIVRWDRGNRSDHHIVSLVRRVSAPVAILLLVELLWIVVVRQINVTGAAAVPPDLVRAMTRGVAAIWMIWVAAHWVAESIISNPQIPTNSLHANLIRFTARFVGIFAGVVLLFRAAQQTGVPVYGLVAGAGVSGLAVALAVRSSLENLVGTLNIYADSPVRVGDECRWGSDPMSAGWIEEIGLRSTRIRGRDRSVTTIPNAEFANMHIVSFGKRDRFLLNKTIGLRYETSLDQLRLVVSKLRDMLNHHPLIETESLRVNVIDLGPSSLDVEIRAYVFTSSNSQFHMIQEELILQTIEIVADAGTAFAFPSMTVYRAQDTGIDSERQEVATKLVRHEVTADEKQR
jgi:MscS family membrane protein